MAIQLTPETKVLFIGDSITDCGWREKNSETVGWGYVRFVRDHLCAKDPASAPQIINRGISGNKITDLQERWESDCLALAPDVLSIYVGINDVWHGLDPKSPSGVPVETYIGTYRELLAQTQSRLPHCTLVLCEPSVIWPPQPAHAQALLKPYVQAVHALAWEFKVNHIAPLHDAFNRAREARPDIPWTTDGVHPTSIGHTLIARTWLQTAGLL